VASTDLNGDGAADYIVTETPSDIWTYDSAPKANPPYVRSFGVACLDSKGRIPRASHSPDPRVGGKISISLDAAPARTQAFLHIGVVQAPIDLRLINMPGCVSYVRPLFVYTGTTDGTGRMQLAAQVPNDNSIAGTTVGLQFFPVDPGLPASVLPVVASHPLEVRVGAQ
jgi:hypothetical protein